jgi:hypothetical protein
MVLVLVLALALGAGCSLDSAGISLAEPVAKEIPPLDSGPGSDRARGEDLGTDLSAPPDAGAVDAEDSGEADGGRAGAGDAAPEAPPGESIPEHDAGAAGAVAPDTGPAPPKEPPAAGPQLLLALSLDERRGSLAVQDGSGLRQQVDVHGLDAARCWVEGRRGGALAFERNGYLRVAVQGPVRTLGAFTFAAWLRRERPDDDGALISRGVAGQGGYAYRVWISGDRLRVQLNDPAARAGLHDTSRATLPVGRWLHVAVTFDGRQVRLYHDGQLTDEWPYTQPLARPDAERPLLIGASESPTDDERVRDRLTGRLDDVTLHGAALDPAAVAALAAGAL